MHINDLRFENIKLSMPLSMQFDLTNQCNLNCRFCYNSSGEIMDDEMDIDEWEELCNDILTQGGIFQCVFSGGEPLLVCDKLFHILNILSKDNTTFILNTNATLLTDKIVVKLLSYRWHWIQVSLDSYDKKAHDLIRGKQSSWLNAIDGIKMLIAHGLPVVIACTITSLNQSIEEMIELALNLNVKGIIFSEVFYSGRASAKDVLSREDHIKLLAEFDKLCKKYSKFIDISIGKTSTEEINDYIKSQPTGILIRPNGDVKLNCVLPYIIGNVLKEPIQEIWSRIYEKDFILKAMQNLDINDKMSPNVYLI